MATMYYTIVLTYPQRVPRQNESVAGNESRTLSASNRRTWRVCRCGKRQTRSASDLRRRRLDRLDWNGYAGISAGRAFRRRRG